MINCLSSSTSFFDFCCCCFSVWLTGRKTSTYLLAASQCSFASISYLVHDEDIVCRNIEFVLRPCPRLLLVITFTLVFSLAVNVHTSFTARNQAFLISVFPVRSTPPIRSHQPSESFSNTKYSVYFKLRIRLFSCDFMTYVST